MADAKLIKKLFEIYVRCLVTFGGIRCSFAH